MIPVEVRFLKFQQKANNKFGSKFAYIEDTFVKHKVPMKMICPSHGGFEQTPDRHLTSKYGCQKCAIDNNKLNTEEFIARSIKIHKDKFNYDKTWLNLVKNEVTITCPIHGDFTQMASSHMNGVGCSQCYFDRQRHSKDDILEKFDIIHQGYYIYNDLNFQSAMDIITITCPLHGEFKQRIRTHLRKSGCSTCGQYKSLKKEYSGNINLYFIRSVEYNFYKIGITRKKLHVRLDNRFPMPYEIIATCHNDSNLLIDLEDRLQSKYRVFKYTPNFYFQGYTECFKFPNKQIKEITTVVESNNICES